MERTTRWIQLALLTATAGLPWCDTAWADGVILNGVSAQTIGRGGTNIAFADNASVLHDNPASMAFMDGEAMLQIGATALFTDFYYTDPDNATRAQHQVYPLPEIAYIKRISDQCACGLGVFSPAGFGSIFNLEGPAPFVGPRQYKSFGSLSKLLFGAAYVPTDFVTVGATIGPGLSFVDLEGPYTLQGAGLPTLLDLSVDGMALVWSAGVTIQLTKTTTLGAAFQSQSKVQADGTADVITPIGNSTYQVDADVVWPRSAGGGVRQQLGKRQVLAADVIWFDWSDAFDTFDISLTGSSNPGLPDIFEQFPLHWRDTVSTRVGYEFHRSNGHVARAGYTHHKSPIPAQTITPFIPAALEHAFSLGYGWGWRGWQINLAYMFTYGPTVSTQTSDLVGGDFDQSTHSDRTHAGAISFTRLIGARRCVNCGSAVR
jgi:long-chain fatty acid transport protein